MKIGLIKEIAVLAFIISIIITFLFLIGYFSYFNIDITKYITSEDLIIRYSVWAWFASVIISTVTIMGFDSFDRFSKSRGWWTKTIRSTQLKIQGLIIIALLVFFLIYDHNKTMVALVYLFGASIIVLLLVVGFMALITNILELKTKKLEISNLIEMLFGMTLIVAFFVGSGYFTAKNELIPKSQFKITLVDKTISTIHNDSFQYIGRTEHYIFIKNIINKRTEIYNAEQVKCIEINN